MVPELKLKMSLFVHILNFNFSSATTKTFIYLWALGEKLKLILLSKSLPFSAVIKDLLAKKNECLNFLLFGFSHVRNTTKQA